jgi:hypothetical protein
LTVSKERSEHLFLVRMWLEPGQVKPAKWRGAVEHVPSGQRFNFISLRDLTDFITLCLEGLPKDNERRGPQ